MFERSRESLLALLMPHAAGGNSFDLLDRLLARGAGALLQTEFISPGSHDAIPGKGAAARVTEALFLDDISWTVARARTNFNPLNPSAKGPPTPALDLLQADATAFAFVEGLQPVLRRVVA